tara:strand:- start:283 stop:480 length:198 start_codon:yes stop_codon:yes gene_type:complete
MGITLVAKGYEGGVSVYLWSFGNYTYELAVDGGENKESSIFNDTSYEEALNKFNLATEIGTRELF